MKGKEEGSLPCNICGSVQKEVLCHVPDYTFHPEESFPLVRCRHCRLVFLDPRPSLTEMGRYYPEDYYHGWEDEACTLLRPNRVALVQDVKATGRILDIGCHRGEFLAQMRQLGWEVWGCEWAESCCAYARKTLGLEHIFEGDFLTHHLPSNFFDVVTLWHVLEHLFDPRKALEEVHRLLRPDGFLLIECPNFNSLTRRLFREKWHQFEAPRHLYHFNQKTLSAVVDRAGFLVSRKRGDTNLFGDLVDLRVSFMRSIGLHRLRARLTNEAAGPAPSPGLLWKAARACFNGICLTGALLAVSLRQGGNLYVVCQKKGGSSV